MRPNSSSAGRPKSQRHREWFLAADAGETASIFWSIAAYRIGVSSVFFQSGVLAQVRSTQDYQPSGDGLGFPKGTDLSQWTGQEIPAAAHALNNRTRKTLGWKTPRDALHDYIRYGQQPSVVTTGVNKKAPRKALFCLVLGGEGGIRTHGSIATTPDFESGTFDHSATSPLEALDSSRRIWGSSCQR